MESHIIIPVSPEAFRIGPLIVSWYGIMVVLAIVAIVVFSAFRARSYGVKSDQIYALALWAVLAGILGARIIHIIDYWSYYLSNPLQIFGFAGFGVYGAIIGAALATGIYSWRKKLSFWVLGDIIAPGAVLGQAIGRLGCTLNGCCYGAETDVPWAFQWTDPGTYAPLGMAVHPAQVYLLLWNLAVFGVLWSLRNRLKPYGSLFLIYIALYSVGDFAIRFFREDNNITFEGLFQAQLVGIILFIGSMATLAVRMYLARRPKVTEEPDSLRGE